MSAVNVQGASKIFNQGTPKQVDALVDVNLTVEPGEFVSLIGPSGCGKSTLLRLIANLLEPTNGEITVNSKTASQSRLDQDYGMAFQQAGLFDWRTVAKNIELPLELKGWDKAKRPNYRTSANHDIIHQHSIHSDKAVFFERATMDDRTMTNMCTSF